MVEPEIDIPPVSSAQAREQVAPPAGVSSVAFVMSRFPKLTETFVLGEFLAIEELGYRLGLFPLIYEREAVVHPEAARLVARARYQPFLSWAVVRSQLSFVLRRPRAYFGALATLVRETFGSRNYLIGGVAVFPKVAHFARLMEAEEVEHVHCHFANHPATAGFIIRRLTGIPYSFTAHGSDLHRDRHMLRRKVSEASFVVAISDYNRRVIVDESGPHLADRVVVVHCGVDTSFFAPALRADVTGRPFAIVCVASFQEVKGHRYLLEACRRLADSGMAFECRLVGEGPLRVEIKRQIAELGLGDLVRADGGLPRGEVAELLRRVDLAVCPSVWTNRGDREGIPVALMEAMASQVAVVASDISGVPELVEHERNGLLVPPGDPEALAAAIARLAGDPELRRRLAEAGRVTVLHDYELHRNAIALVRLIEAARPARDRSAHS